MLALCDKLYCLLRMEFPEYCCLLPVDNLLNVHEMHCFSFSVDLYIFNKFSCHSLCVLIHSLSSNRSQHYISLTNKCYLSFVVVIFWIHYFINFFVHYFDVTFLDFLCLHELFFVVIIFYNRVFNIIICLNV